MLLDAFDNSGEFDFLETPRVEFEPEDTDVTADILSTLSSLLEEDPRLPAHEYLGTDRLLLPSWLDTRGVMMAEKGAGILSLENGSFISRIMAWRSSSPPSAKEDDGGSVRSNLGMCLEGSRL